MSWKELEKTIASLVGTSIGRWLLLKILCSHKAAGQFRRCNFPYYDQLTSIYAKDQATRKDAQTTANIVKEIDVEDVAIVNNLEEG
ncbi:hypothetical protein Godav_021423 [Gossypium davidsonii]|uniref:Uncharacterized protein n=1 Tax=Gossypium davidsonii TaxID=34287 RepID=A0A7J8R671_GOSDV|nr:hypothetical protein [Gossypium davidsonii]